MKSDGHYRHPMLVNAQKIKENGIVILDDVRELPSGKEPFTSPDYVICIGHRGTMQMTYDDMPDHSSKQTVAVVFPNHTLRMVSKSDDYLATLVVVDAALLDDPIDIPNRQHFMMSQLEFFMRLLSHYRTVKLNETAVEKRVSTLFSNDLAQYFREHRDVGFYAAKVCLTPKHFSTVIRQETGHTAAWWIHRQVVSEAKNLLTMRPDLNIQAVADQLGFADQATFSRYFHRETGLYPTEFREGNTMCPKP